MIKINELRVDNLVYNSYTKQNMQVYPMMIHQLYRIEKENGSLKDCNIEPIPLTEEILLKCGFVLLDDNVFIHEELRYSDTFKIREDGYIAFVSREVYITKIKYLHELQNLFFAITGEELEVNF